MSERRAEGDLGLPWDRDASEGVMMLTLVPEFCAEIESGEWFGSIAQLVGRLRPLLPAGTVAPEWFGSAAAALAELRTAIPGLRSQGIAVQIRPHAQWGEAIAIDGSASA